jgi:WD40 repeat protein
MLVATGSKDGTVKIWDASTGANLLTFPGGSAGATGISFNLDGTRFAVKGGEGGVYIFVLPIDDVIALAKSRLTRSLTTEECQQYLHMAICPAAP